MATEAHIQTTGADELLERAAELSVLERLCEEVNAGGRGRMLLIAGEAGVGKSALLRDFCERRDPASVLAGACDALFTPRPLGPLLDIAEDAGGQLAALATEGTGPRAITSALRSELLRRRRPVLALEDLH